MNDFKKIYGGNEDFRLNAQAGMVTHLLLRFSGAVLMVWLVELFFFQGWRPSAETSVSLQPVGLIGLLWSWLVTASFVFYVLGNARLVLLDVFGLHRWQKPLNSLIYAGFWVILIGLWWIGR